MRIKAGTGARLLLLTFGKSCLEAAGVFLACTPEESESLAPKYRQAATAVLVNLEVKLETEVPRDTLPCFGECWTSFLLFLSDNSPWGMHLQVLNGWSSQEIGDTLWDLRRGSSCGVTETAGEHNHKFQNFYVEVSTASSDKVINFSIYKMSILVSVR